MNPLKTREIARRLAERDNVEPPEGLLDKIKSEIPAVLPAAPRIVPGVVERLERRPRRRVWLMAASVAAALGGGFLGLRLMQSEHASSLAKQESMQERVVAPAPADQEDQARSAAVSRDKDEAKKKREEEKLRSLGYLSQPQAAPAPEPPPPPRLLAAKPESPAPVMPLEVEKGVEGGVEGGVPGGVVGGVPGGVIGSNEAQEQTRQRDNAADLRRDEAPAKTAAPAPSPEPNDRPNSDVLPPSAGGHPSAGTSSYTMARHSLLDEGRLPPPEAVRTEDFVRFFSGSENRFAALAAELAEVLRGSSEAKNVNLDDLVTRAHNLAAEKVDAKRAADVKDFVQMVETAVRLKKK